MIAQRSFRPAGALGGEPFAPYGGPWDQRMAAHLLRRAGFGGTPQEVDRVANLTMNAAVDELIHFPSSDAFGEPADIDFDDTNMSPLSQDERRMARHRADVALQMWWLDRMAATPAPLQEKMTFFWHGHFTTEVLVKGISPREALTQNALYRNYALGDVRALAHAVSRDPAMLKYLDNARNRKEHPNENYARELMELFTLGIGNYTERDVREGARAFTGWTVRRDVGFVEAVRQHDDGEKTFLARTGDFDGDDVVNIIFEQPACARWFSRKLLEFFVYDDPEPELIDHLAAALRKNDYRLAPVMSMVLRSNLFYSARAYRALVKSPVEFVVGTYRLYGIREVGRNAVPTLNGLGQRLFHPPNVKGWDGGESWLNSQQLLTRENFANSVVSSRLMGGDAWIVRTIPMNAREAARELAEGILQGDASPAAVARLEAYLDGADTSALAPLSPENFPERIRGAAYLTMAMPAYQLN